GVLAQAEVVGVVGQVLVDLLMARVVGPVVGHREVGELGERLGGDEVGRGVHGAAAVPPVPCAADAGLTLEAVHRDAVLAQVLDGRQPAAPGADHAEGLAAVVDRAVAVPDLGAAGPLGGLPGGAHPRAAVLVPRRAGQAPAGGLALARGVAGVP